MPHTPPFTVSNIFSFTHVHKQSNLQWHLSFILLQAAENGQEDVLRQYLPLTSPPELDAKDDHGYTAVHYAAEFNHIKILELLLEANASELFIMKGVILSDYVYVQTGYI